MTERRADSLEPAALLEPAELEAAAATTARLIGELDRALLGRSELHRLVVVAILSRGHMLLEGLPGVGKTALVKCLGGLLGLDFKRVQFTPDLMPGDILGTHILQQDDRGHRAMTFEAGPVFTNLLLADEINRASPKTQSALLEAMQERTVTLLGTTRALPDPFFVLASQNPIELEGTYPLPEAQLDRFLFKLAVPNASVEVLEGIVATRRRGEPPAPTWRLEAQALSDLFGSMERIVMARPVGRYIARLVAASHAGAAEAPEVIAQYVTYGASPRAAIALSEAARAHALTGGRPSVGFEDVRAVAPAVLNHRLILNYKARLDRVGPLEVVTALLAAVDAAGLVLPRGIELTPPVPH